MLLILSELVTCGISYPGPAGDVTAKVVIGNHMACVTVAQDIAPVRKSIANTGFGRRMTLVHGVADVCHHSTFADRAETMAEVKW